MEELGVRDEEPRRAQGGAVVQRMLKSLRESRTRTGGRELIPKPRKELGRKGSSPRSQSAVPSLQPSLWLQAAEVRGVEVEAQAEVGDRSKSGHRHGLGGGCGPRSLVGKSESTREDQKRAGGPNTEP